MATSKIKHTDVCYLLTKGCRPTVTNVVGLETTGRVRAHRGPVRVPGSHGVTTGLKLTGPARETSASKEIRYVNSIPPVIPGSSC